MWRLLILQLEDASVLKAGSPPDLSIHEGDLCVVDENHVLEFGPVVKLEERPDAEGRPSAVALRRATLLDQARARENAVAGRMAMRTALKRIEEQKLAIRLVQLRYSFDRTVLFVTYTAEERVECHELAKSLASDLQVRVALKQIGVRDAAKLVGGLGPCGRILCCHSWLKEFDGVSVRMAKAQRVPLNPGTIGGMCSRLKCCLRYEFDAYRRLGERLPADGTQVQCPAGSGRVVDQDILGQLVKVRLEDGRILTFKVEEIELLPERGEKGGAPS